jgi:hypothetical protein
VRLLDVILRRKREPEPAEMAELREQHRRALERSERVLSDFRRADSLTGPRQRRVD